MRSNLPGPGVRAYDYVEALSLARRAANRRRPHLGQRAL